MSEQAFSDPLRVRGERTPVWLPWGLALVGLIGLMFSVNLLFSEWRSELVQSSIPAEISAPANHIDQTGAKLAQQEDSASSGQADKPKAFSGHEGNRTRLDDETALVVEETSEPLLSPKPSPPPIAASETEPDDSTTRAAPAIENAAMRQGEVEQASSASQEGGLEVKPVGDAGAPIAAVTDQAAKAGTGSAPDNAETADLAEPDLQPSQTDAQPPPGPTANESALESQTTSASMIAESTGPRSTAPVTAERDQAGKGVPDQESTNAPDAIEPRQDLAPGIAGQSSAIQEQSRHPVDTDSERKIDKSGIECAPLFSVGFGKESSKPQSDNLQEKIAHLAQWLSAHPSEIVYVEGYADPWGSEEFNMALSFRRATAVAKLLTKAGASKSQLVVRAYGESKPPSPSSESQSGRRVTLKTDTGIPCDQQVSKDGGSP